MVQVEKIVVGTAPTGDELERSIQGVVSMYPVSVVPAEFEHADVKISRGRVRQVFRDLNPDASSGYPWMIQFPTKQDFVNRDPERLIDLVLSRLSVRQSTTLKEIERLGPVGILKKGLCDPIRVFVKSEFHSVEKYKEGRMRLISNVSIVDEIIERLLYTNQNTDHQNHCLSGQGTAVGWDISTDLGVQAAYESVEKHLDKAADSDVSGWDMSVKEWGFTAEAEIRKRLCTATKQSSWCHQSDVHFGLTCRSVYVVTDGTMYCSTMNGLQNSGKYLTSYSNSIQRNLLAFLMGCDWSISMGDDNVSTYVENAVEKAYKFGFRLKNYKKVDRSKGFEFCSHMFLKDRAIPINPDKGFANLLAKSPSRVAVEDFLRVYRHVDGVQLAVYVSILDACGYLKACPEKPVALSDVIGVSAGLEVNRGRGLTKDGLQRLQKESSW